MTYELRITKNTIAKQSTLQSTDPAVTEKVDVKEGECFPVAAWAPAADGHLKITLGKDKEGKQLTLSAPERSAKNTWFFFGGHCSLMQGEKVVTAIAPSTPVPGGAYTLHLTRHKNGRDQFGCSLFDLSLMRSGRIVDVMAVVSGAPGRSPVPPSTDFPGSMNPIPEGVYRVGRVDETLGSFGPALGRFWVPLDVLPRFDAGNRRSAIGFHEDANRAWAPGSAGCVCPLNGRDMEDLAGWIRRHQIKELVVNHGYGFLASRGYK